MGQDLISVVVPVYNVKQYLTRCLDSIINQTYSYLEIIIIDDGSTDDSGKICDEYSIKDQRIRVIHKTNGGLSDARNVGIDKANGKYISFVDSDDYLHPEFIEILYKNICEYKADVSICGFIKGTNSKFSGKTKRNECKVFKREEMLGQWHGKYRHIETQAWNKLYLKDLFTGEKIRYPRGMNHEDVQTTHLVIAACNRVVITESRLYYYFQRSDSITNSTFTDKRIYDILEAQNRRLYFFKNHNYLQAYERLKIKMQKYFMLLYCLAEAKGLSEIENDFINEFHDNYVEVRRFKELGFFNRIMFDFFNKHYKMIRFIIQIWECHGEI